MKRRMITIYQTRTPPPTLNGRPIGEEPTWWGDCPHWAKSIRDAGLPLTATRTLVLNPQLTCGCVNFAHQRA